MNRIISHKSFLTLINSRSGKLFFIFGIQGINALLGFTVQLIISNNLTTSEYGKFNMLFNAISILVLVISLGSTNYILRKISTIENPEKVANVLNKTISYVFINWLTICSISYIVIQFMIKSTAFPITNIIFLTSAIWLFLNTLTILFQNFDRARGYAIRSMLPSSIFKSIVLIGSLGLGMIYLDQFELHYITSAYLLSFLIACILYIFYEKKFINIEQLFRKVCYKKTFRESSQYFINKIAQNLLKNLDLLLIGFFLTDFDAGIYGAATKINIIIIFGLSSLNILYSPQVAQLFHKNKISELNKSLKTPNLIIFLYSFILFIIIVFTGEHLLDLFGEEYSEAYWILFLLSLRNLTEAFFGITGSILNMTGNQKYFNQILYLLLFMYLIASPFVIKFYELEGFAFFLVLLAFIKNFIQWRYIYYKLKIKSGILSNVLEKLNVL